MDRAPRVAIGISVVLSLSAGLAVGFLRGQSSDRFERVKTADFVNGIAWTVMSSEEKASYLLGFDEGIRTACGQAAYKGWLKQEQKDQLVREMLVRNRPGVDLIDEMDRIYKDDANLRLPIRIAYEAAKYRTGELTEEGVQSFLEHMRKALKK